MKDIVFLLWLIILLLNPLVDNSVDYITLQQCETAYILFGLLCIINFYGVRALNKVMLIFAIFYAWVAISDKLITNMPLWVSNLEALIVFLVVIYKVRFDKRL